jgi:LmbE family N-acetylglucosaminyl deacetylase
MIAAAMEPFLDPPPAPKPCSAPPIAGAALVVAPHPDDEWIGPGGTLLLHRARGDRVHVVVVTDGASDGGAKKPEDRVALAATRAAESRAFAKELGATIELLGHPDGGRAREEDLGALVPQLVAAIQRERPSVVYAPHRDEIHGDHHVVSIAVQRAVAKAGVACALLAYEVWGTLAADYVVDITGVMERKLALASCFPSQLRHTAIAHCFGGLNAYRSAFLAKGARYGEAFRRLLPDENAR